MSIPYKDKEKAKAFQKEYYQRTKEERREKKNKSQREYSKRTNYESQAKYAKSNLTRINIALNNNTDADILQRLKNEPNKNGYIKKLIREDIAKQEKKQ